MIPPLGAFVQGEKAISHRIMAFDPGETTGFCVFEGCTLLAARQLQTKTLDQSFSVLEKEFLKFMAYGCGEVVIEDYRVYGWKTEEHSFAGLHTPKLIGMLVTFCIRHNLPYTLRMAQPAKAFVTDEKLEAWDLFNKGQRHSRDAMRHALFQLIFGKKDESKD